MTDVPDLPERIDDGGEHPIIPWLTERRRAYFYRVLGALLLAAFLVEALTAVQLLAAAGVVAAVLGTGLAAMHTSTRAG